ncbi:MAG TPA: YceI family protein [Candidatus Paceibacterota bacterium]|nr:YceI family protein [Candidatus Paceibacterota bacterium]
MKTYLFIIVAALVAGGAYWIFMGGKSGGSEVMEESPTPEPKEEFTVPADGDYLLDSDASSMTWRGRKPLINGYYDTGSVALSGGAVTIADGGVASGSIVVDMTTIAATDTGRGSADNFRSMLSRHLQSEDFFNVEEYPTGEFALTDLVQDGDGAWTLSGSLTVKGIANPVSFPVRVTNEGGVLSVTAENVELDRTKWDIRFGSGSFFENLGDNLIDDIFTVSFTAVFRSAP